jgi:Tol biopolymer transport system component
MLAAGTRIGPYEVLSAIGAGGMGEVYRARDPRLKRDVAIKVLPPSFSSDPQRLQRFEQEAHATAALNHPNILAVHDIGQQDGAPYIVSELLEGETLREKLRAGPAPVRKTIEYAQQIARGLAAAHDKGIVHRDLKPENVFITRDGRAKILDFGLAKLTRSESGADDQTCTIQSELGSVVGTVGYMAPEQARGKPADARTDLFALGAILYELLTGHRAFRGETPADTISAILQRDPPELSATNREVPPALERIMRHCLEKNPEERFQSARDVAFDLESVTASSTTTPTAETEPRRMWRATAGLIGLALLVAGGALIGRTWLVPATRQPEFRRVTFRRGSIRMARFAPDGQTVFYGAAWDGKPVEVFALQYETADSRSVGVTGQVLSVSRNGEVAVLLNPKVLNFVQSGTLAVIPVRGGAPRELLDGVQFAEWSPDGKAMAIVRFSAASGVSWIEYPAGKIIYRGPAWISHLRISPDGNLLAFAQHVHNGDDGDVVIMDRDGKQKFASPVFLSLQGLAWRPDGREVWFTASRGLGRGIYAVDMLGKQRLVLRAPGSLVLHDIGNDGRVLLTNDHGRKQMFALIQGDKKERNISWLDWSVLQVLSEDAQQVLFAEGGEGNPKYGLYLRGVDGSLPKRIADGYWGDLSPDGKWVIVQDPGTPAQFMLVPTGIGEARQITHDNLIHLYPRFLPGGHAIVFVAATSQGAVRMYYQSLDGGDPVAITPEGSGGYPSLITVSRDGVYLVAPAATAESYAMYPVHGGPPRALKGLSTGDAVVNWSADGKYLYTYTRGEAPARIYRVEIASGKRELFKVTEPPDNAGVEDVTNLHITRDGRSYAYTCPTILSDLYVVDGLR